MATISLDDMTRAQCFNYLRLFLFGVVFVVVVDVGFVVVDVVFEADFD